MKNKITLAEIKQEREDFHEQGLLWSPNSVYHGAPLRGNRLNLSNEIVLRNQVENLNDFLEFLFEQSEHCDHISQNDAYDEFLVYQANN